MNKKIIIASICSLSLISTLSFGQFNSKCATDDLIKMHIRQNPSLQEAVTTYENNLRKNIAAFEKEQASSAQKTTANKVVALVFHIVLSQAQIDQIGGTQGIYDRIATQVEVLNTDFNGLNTDTVPTVFKPLKGNAQLNFSVAHKSPSGSGTTGVEIKIASPSYGGFMAHDGSVKSSVSGGLSPWNNQKYLNIWVTDITNSGPGEILGYAYSPGYANALGNNNLAGVVLDYLSLGKRTSITQAFTASSDRGRTLVHEMGHFFTLAHIWGNTAVGSGTCSDDDGVTDTPVQQDANQSVCPSFPQTNCGNTAGGEMFMNYMDYVPDLCMRMFSNGQVSRMLSEFSPNGGSYNLQFSEDLVVWPNSISNIEIQNGFEITPNPSNGVFNITLNNTATTLKAISVINSLGQIVKQIKNNDNNQKSFSLDLTGMNQGVYSTLCQFEEGIVTRKVVLQ